MGDRKIIYNNLFKEGVMVAKKDCTKAKHDDEELPVKNIYVIKLLTSLKSRGYVTEKFSWQWYYWYLTNEGIEYLREYLNLPEEVVPNTLKKSSRPASRGWSVTPVDPAARAAGVMAAREAATTATAVTSVAREATTVARVVVALAVEVVPLRVASTWLLDAALVLDALGH